MPPRAPWQKRSQDGPDYNGGETLVSRPGSKGVSPTRAHAAAAVGEFVGTFLFLFVSAFNQPPLNGITKVLKFGRDSSLLAGPMLSTQTSGVTWTPRSCFTFPCVSACRWASMSGESQFKRPS